MSRKLNLPGFFSMIRQTYREWSDSDPFRQSAIISYYAILSLPGLLIIIIWSLGRLFGDDFIQGKVTGQISRMLGGKKAGIIEDLVTNAYLDADAMWYMQLIGVVTLIFGATTLFFQLQKTLNHIWNVEPDTSYGIRRLLVDRANSLGLIMVIAFLMLISLILSTLLSTFNDVIEGWLGGDWKLVIQVLNIAISFGVITVLFALMFKVLPDVEFTWKTVWIGAIFTTLLFNLGKTALGYYFSVSDPSSGFGAAGTVVLIMIWINYTTLILLFGAQFTQVYARRMGYAINPSKHARWNRRYVFQHKEALYSKILSNVSEELDEMTDQIQHTSYFDPTDRERSEKLLQRITKEPELSRAADKGKKTSLSGRLGTVLTLAAILLRRDTRKKN